MDRKDCEKGMEVEYNDDSSYVFEKGQRLTISEIRGQTISFKEGGVSFPERVDPINKFEVGEPVLCEQRDISQSYFYKGKILFVADEPDNYNNKYLAEIYSDKGQKEYIVISEQFIHKRKKKDELESGDKFRKNLIEYRVLDRSYDERFEETVYFAKRISGDCKGMLGLISADDIDKIIYN